MLYFIKVLGNKIVLGGPIIFAQIKLNGLDLPQLTAGGRVSYTSTRQPAVFSLIYLVPTR
jgi:hypothetical protein